jgi:hypothetical protein
MVKRMPGRRLRVVLLQPQRVAGYFTTFQAGTGPDPVDLFRRLAAQGIDLVRKDPAGWPPR